VIDNVLFVSIDSLRRDFLGAYSDSPDVMDGSVETDALDAFAERAAVFDAHYAGSLPCMPARREWLTGTREFLWRPWGPIEPFDDPIPRLARENGVLSQFFTDHYHYFQHGSHGYYEDYHGFEFVRGHEFDAWRTTPRDVDGEFHDQIADSATDPPGSLEFMNRSQYARNVAGKTDEEEFFAPQVFERTADWLADADEWDRWFAYVDSFDVHEPFHCPEPYASMYTDEDPTDPDLPVWPYYGPIDEGQSELTERELAFVRSQFAGKVTMVDRWLGRVFDALDEAGLWDETMVVVTSDHGFFLGDHGWVGKNEPPVYDVLANTPLLIWHPESPHMGERVSALTSAVDLYATMLEALGIDVPDESHSRSFMPLLRDDADAHRDRALYGYWGSAVNVTDGRHTYFRPCDPTRPTDCYSTEMMNPNGWFVPRSPKESAESGPFLPYTDTPVWRFEGASFAQLDGEHLYDVREDPRQRRNLVDEDPDVADRMRDHLVAAMDDLDAPEGQYERLGLAE
jgi:arylsulfatase A-like enzyme